MPRIMPYAGSSHTRLSELIRRAQNPALPESTSFSFSNLRVGSGNFDGDTVVTAVATLGSRVDDPIDVTYRRLGINALSMLPPDVLSVVPARPPPFSIHEILPDINEALGLNLTPDEVLDQLFKESKETYPLTIKQAASYAWYASVYNFKMAPLVTDIDLAVVFANPVLDGLEYVQP